MDGLPHCRGSLKIRALKGMQKMKRRIGIAVRVREIRSLYGENGVENLAGAGSASSDLANYEQGVTMPAELLLSSVLAAADPNWLLTGDGERMIRRFYLALERVRHSAVIEHD